MQGAISVPRLQGGPGLGRLSTGRGCLRGRSVGQGRWEDHHGPPLTTTLIPSSPPNGSRSFFAIRPSFGLCASVQWTAWPMASPSSFIAPFLHSCAPRWLLPHPPRCSLRSALALHSAPEDSPLASNRLLAFSLCPVVFLRQTYFFMYDNSSCNHSDCSRCGWPITVRIPVLRVLRTRGRFMEFMAWSRRPSALLRVTSLGSWSMAAPPRRGKLIADLGEEPWRTRRGWQKERL